MATQYDFLSQRKKLADMYGELPTDFTSLQNQVNGNTNPTPQQSGFSYPEFKGEMPNAPTYDRINVGDAPERSNFNYYQDLTDQITTKPMTQEEEDARVKAASTIQGIGALGNALSAFGNIAYTGGVAPSQKIADLPDTNKDIQTFRDRVNKNREQYLRYKMAGRQADDNAYNNAYSQYVQGVNQNNNAAQNEFNSNMTSFNTSRGIYDKDRQFNFGVQKDARDFDFKKSTDERNFAETQRHNRFSEGIQAAANKRAQDSHDFDMKVKREAYNNGTYTSGGKGGGKSSGNNNVSNISGFRIVNGAPVKSTISVNWSKLMDTPSAIEQVLHEVNSNGDPVISGQLSAERNRELLNANGDPKKKVDTDMRIIGQLIQNDSTGTAVKYLDEQGYTIKDNSGEEDTIWNKDKGELIWDTNK